MLSIQPTFEELKQELEAGSLLAGRLTPLFSENFLIVDPTSVEGKEFQAYAENIARTLLPQHDFHKLPVRFVLSKDTQVNGFAVVHSQPGNPKDICKPIIICFNQGLIDLVEYEDELAEVMGHELNHSKLAIDLGTGPNSKTEEGMSDLRPIWWLYTAGYHPEAALDFSEKMKAIDNEDLLKVMGGITDVHPLPTSRSDAISKALAVHNKNVGGYEGIQRRPMPDRIRQLVQNSTHESYYAKKLKEVSFDSLSGLEQVKFIQDEIRNLNLDYVVRVKDLITIIRSSHCDPNEPDQKKVMEEIVSELRQRPSLFYLLYAQVTPGLFQVKPNSPVGEFIDLYSSVKNLINAQSLPEAQRAAVSVLQRHERLSNGGAIILSHLRWPQFAFPFPSELTRQEARQRMRKEGIELPWNKQVAWANKQLAAGDNTLCKALFALGVMDPRLIDYAPDQLLKNILTEGRSKTVFNPVKIINPYPPQMEFCDLDTGQGIITGYHGPAGNDLSNAALYHHNSLTWQVIPYIEDTIELRKREAENRSSKEASEQESATQDQNVTREWKVFTFFHASNEDFVANFPQYLKENLTYLIPPFIRSLRPEKEEEKARQRDGDIKSEEDEYRIEMDMLAQDYRELAAYHLRCAYLVKRFKDLLRDDRDKYGPFVREFFTAKEEGGNIHAMATKNQELNYDNPLIKFVLKDEYEIFQPGERGEVVGTFSRALFIGSQEMDQRQEEINKTMIQACVPYQNTWDRLKKYEFIGPNCYLLRSTLKEAIGVYLSQEKEPGILDFIKHMPECVKTLNWNEYEGEDELAGLFKNRLKKIRKWPNSPAELIDLYNILDGIGLFPSEAWRARLADRIIEHVDQQKSPKKKVELLEMLLLDTMIKDYGLRNQTTQMWVDTLSDLHGKDDGSQTYADKMKPVIQRVHERTNFAQRLDIFTRLSEAIESQRELSHEFGDRLTIQSRQEMTDAHMKIMGLEAFITFIKDMPGRRQELIEFFINPLTSENIHNIKDDYRYFLNQESSIEGGPTGLDPDIALKRMHENFWNMPLAGRVLIVDELLIPAGKRNYNEKEVSPLFTEAFTYVVDRLLPWRMPYAQESRKILEAYSRVVPHYARSLLLSSMLVAGEKARESGEKMSVGQRLAIVLDLMGPAERKLGQAIHSNPQTPPDIRQGFKRLKSMAAKPMRWDLFDLYDATVPPAYQKNITRLGGIKGSASYFVTAVADRADGTQGLLRMMRQDARRQAKYGFDQLQRLTQELRREDTALGNVADAMGDMIEFASSKVLAETDMQEGLKQYLVACKLYNGTQIMIDGHTMHFKVPRWLAYGDSFCDQELMAGEHFDDLPERSPRQKRFKHIHAKGHTAMEFINILAGDRFDDDRHGAQCRIEENAPGTSTFGIFDHGGIELQHPSAEEKMLLTRSLFNGFKALRKGIPLAEVMYDEVRKAKEESGHMPHYLSHVQRGLLALNSFFINDRDQTILTPDDITDILTAIYQTGKIDDTILTSMMTMALTGLINPEDIALLNASAKEPVRISQQEMPLPEPPPYYAVENKKLEVQEQDIKAKPKSSRKKAISKKAPDDDKDWRQSLRSHPTEEGIISHRIRKQKSDKSGHTLH